MKNRDMKELREKCIEMDELLKKENIKIYLHSLREYDYLNNISQENFG